MTGVRIERRLSATELAPYVQLLLTAEGKMQLVAVTAPLLQRAALSLPVPVKSLDAIHLTTALVVGETLHPDLIFATHDAQQAPAASAMGFPIVGLNS